MPLDLARIQAICFDLDGTLSNTDDRYTQRIAGLLRPFTPGMSRQARVDQARRMVYRLENPGSLGMDLLDRLGIDLAANWLSESFDRLSGSRPRVYSLIPGVRELLDLLQPLYPLAIVSSRGRLTISAFLNHFHLAAYFQAVAAAQTTRYTKPRPDPLLWAAGCMNVSPQACLMVGDTTVDIRAGKAAGAQTVGVLCGFGQEAELRQAGADLILASTTDLAEALK